MISHANGSAEWHREQLGIKTPEQKRIEQLEAEVERLKATDRFLRSERPMARKLTEVEAEPAECKRDAERYRWLRDKAFTEDRDGGYVKYYVFPNVCYANGADYKGHKPYYFSTLDSAIDSAIAAQNHCVETNNRVKGEGK